LHRMGPLPPPRRCPRMGLVVLASPGGREIPCLPAKRRAGTRVGMTCPDVCRAAWVLAAGSEGKGRGKEVMMPDGILSKSQAEVALDLVKSYLDYAGEEARERYREADAFFALFEKAYKLIMDVSERRKPQPGFHAG